MKRLLTVAGTVATLAVAAPAAASNTWSGAPAGTTWTGAPAASSWNGRRPNPVGSTARVRPAPWAEGFRVVF